VVEGAGQNFVSQLFGGLAAVSILHQLHPDHEAFAADITDAVEPALQLAQSADEIVADASRILRILALNQIEGRERGSAGHGITTIGITVGTSFPPLHETAPGHGHSDRQS